MPAKVKVKIIAGKDLPVMDRSSETTDAYVEIKLGNTTYKTDVCRKSLNPQWNSDWYRFEMDDSELQDEPLQIRVMDHDTYSANDAIGKVYLDLNPLLIPAGSLLPKVGCGEPVPTNDSAINSIMSGWIPVFDTMHGIRGEVEIMVKVELFSDFNKFRQSSCGVQFFYSKSIPYGYIAQMFHGFVEELIVNDDPEYQWIDKIRTPRTTNEARQTLFFKLCKELQRKIGLKTLEMGGNAVVGYSQSFDLEGESGVVVRGTGTAVTLIKLRNIPSVTTADTSYEERALRYLHFLCSDSNPHLNKHNTKTSNLTLNITSPQILLKKETLGSSAIRKQNFTRHLSYNDFGSSSNPMQSSNRTDEIQQASSLQMLLQQEEMRGIPGSGLSQCIRNLKYSSQNILFKKMTALKAKLSDTGMVEESESDLRSSCYAIYKPEIPKKKPQKFSDSNAMAELLVRTIMYSSLNHMNETNDNSMISTVSTSIAAEPNKENKDVESISLLNKSLSDLHFLEPEFLIQLETSSNIDLSFDSSSSEEDEDTLSDTKDDSALDFDTVSNIVKSVSVVGLQTNSDNLSNSLCKTDSSETLLKNETRNIDINLENTKERYAPLAVFEDSNFEDSEIVSSDSVIGLKRSTGDLELIRSTATLPLSTNSEKDQDVTNTVSYPTVNREKMGNCMEISENNKKCILETQSNNSPDSFSPSNKLIVTNNDKQLSFNKITPTTSYENTVFSKPVNSELDSGTSNMHASFGCSLRNTGSSPIAETVRNDIGHHRTESFGTRISQSPAKFYPIPFVHRRSSDSDLSITPKGNSLTGSDKSFGMTNSYFSRVGAFLHSSAQQDNFSMLEYPFMTLTKYPPGFIICLGSVVSARSVKLLDRTSNLEEPEARDSWWAELRMEIRSHARSLNCNAVLAYSESSSICDDVCVLSASGTGAIVGFQYCNEMNDNLNGLPIRTKSNYGNKETMASSLDRNDFEHEKGHQKLDIGVSNIGINSKPLIENPENELESTSISNMSSCTFCHLPFAGNLVPLRSATQKCAICRSAKVPDILLSTTEVPDGVPSVGRGCFIEAHVSRSLKEARGESGAKDISDRLPFLEYELHRILVNKIKIKGMNSLFGLKVKITVGIKLLVGIATGTGVFLSPLPPPSLPKLVSSRSKDEKRLVEMQKLLTDTLKANKDLYQLKSCDETVYGRISPDNEYNEDEFSLLDLAAESRDCSVLELDDPDDMEVMNMLMERRPPDGFHVVNTEFIPGFEEMEIIKNVQMFTHIWRSKVFPLYNLGVTIEKLLQGVYFKLRNMVPCALCNVQFKIDLPETEDFQVSVVGVALELDITQQSMKSKQHHSFRETKKHDEDMIFNLEEDSETNDSSLLNAHPAKVRSRSPYKPKNQFIKHLVYHGKYGVDITSLSYIPGGKVEKYLGNLNFVFIRETTSLREEGGMSGFIHSFITEVLSIVRSNIVALGGNAMISYYLTKCVLQHSMHKNQGQCLINVGGDVALVTYLSEE